MPTVRLTTRLALPLRLLAPSVRTVPRPIRQFFYRSPLLGSAIQRLLARSTPERLAEVQVESSILRGARLRLNLRTERGYWLGTYELQLMAALAHSCRAGMVVYDLGANIGYTTLAFARAVGETGRVYAFEPLPDNTRRLAEHVALNGFQGTVRLVPCAVSDREGLVRFFVHYSHLQGRIASPAEKTELGKQIDVPSLRLDDFVYRDGNSPPDVVKIDIEGGASKAIPGMARILADKRPIIFIEIHDDAEQQITWDTLERSGYQLRRLQPGYPQPTGRDELTEEWPYHLIARPIDSGSTP
ncbi:MAG TPA: FkbM family methyltransferase [Roseiflexaceae bacterium]|jgi:FkbM family methyltransferase